MPTRRRPSSTSSSQTRAAVVAALLLLIASSCDAAVDMRHLRFLDEDTPLPVIVGYKKVTEGGATTLASVSSSSNAGPSSSSRYSDQRLSGGEALDRVSARKGKLTRSEVQQLMDSDPDILYVEEDFIMRPLAEVIPYGIEAINAYGQYPPQPSAALDSGAPCSDPSSFKIGIVDSGLDVNHPDLPCYNTGDSSLANCVGTTFGLGVGDGEWSSPNDIHGTFVTGIIGAIRGNGIGVTGVLNNRNVCLIMARVFGGSGSGEALMSDVLEGVQYVVNQGANVINLSLGGPGYSQTADNFYQSVNDQNRLVFCASGNDGTTDLFYPASYSSTVAVGAVDSSLNRATFSQYNQEVDLVAPGRSILSTAPLGYGTLYQIDAGGQVYLSLLLAGSPQPQPQLSGSLVVCPDLGQSVCPGDGTSGHICLIERGTALFGDKALNCQNGGGAAAIIYNNEEGYFMGTVGSASGELTIPVYAVDRATGQALLQQTLATLLAQDGYTVSDGTSFASPYAAGAAAAVWQACPGCSNGDVRNCLEGTARDLGTSGRDDQYGHGLVQVDAAYLCLVQTNGCCAGNASPVPPTTPAPFPVSAPTVPVPSPVSSPTPPSGGCLTYDTQQCLNNEFESVEEAKLCLFCVQNSMNDIANTPMTCEEYEDAVCKATRVECQCYTCSDEIEGYLSCTLEEDFGCPRLDCSAYQPDPNSTSIDVRMCAEKHLQMESCLSLSTAGNFAASQQQEESECSKCLLGSLPSTFAGKSCYEINRNLICPLLDDCSEPCILSQCSQQVVSYMDCVVDLNSRGCNLDCEKYDAGESNNSDGDSTPDGATSAASSFTLAVGWTAHLLSLACWLAMARLISQSG